MKHIRYAGRLPALSAKLAIQTGARPCKICASGQDFALMHVGGHADNMYDVMVKLIKLPETCTLAAIELSAG